MREDRTKFARSRSILAGDSRDRHPVQATPFLKWPGGKGSLLKFIFPHLPVQFGTYFEPFLGGGALFFALAPRKAILGDLNQDLVNCYLQVRDRPNHVLAILRRLRNSERDYYRVRASRPKGPLSRAARFIYLTTLSFNGIHRLNQRGEFNVPYGYKDHLVPADRARLTAAGTVLQAAKISAVDFDHTLESARAGDLVYLDPPYTVAHGNNGFLKYNDRIFSWSDQVRLARSADHLRRHGCTVIVSNALHESVLGLYPRFMVQTIARSSVIAADTKHRRRVEECILVGRA